MTATLTPPTKKRRVVDPQKNRLYAAEKALVRKAEFSTLDECQDYIDGILKSPWWKNRHSDVTYISLRDGRGRRSACASRPGRYIKLPLWARSRYVILHEMAHVVTPDRFQSHGREYAQNLYDLILRWLGPEAADTFLAGCVEHRVKIGKRRPAFKSGRTADEVILATGKETLPIWASEGTAFWSARVWHDDPDGCMFEGDEVRYFPGLRNAQRWAKTRNKDLDGGEIRVEKMIWDRYDGWTQDPEAEAYDYHPKYSKD